MKMYYEAPELELITFNLKDVILASTEGTIGETIGTGGGGSGDDPFNDID